jgi:dTMP kinase
MFVTFEGPEGAGKSTLISGLVQRLRGQGRDATVSREPGAGAVGGAIREILLGGEAVQARAELFLFLADRAQHVEAIVRPALARGEIVLCDRHADSTLVYQGYGRGLDLVRLREWNAYATDGLCPDLTLLLDLDPRIGLARLSSPDRIDREPLEFHVRVREGFLLEATREPGRWRILDATRPPEEVLEAAWRAIHERASDG